MANSLPILPLINFLFLLPAANSVSFNISRFEDDTKNILYQGDAKASAGVIEFNIIDFQSRVGRATYAEGIPLWDSDTNRVSDFTTHFSFFIDTQGLSVYGHGLVFFIAPVGFQIPQNSAGGFLGLFNTSTNGSSQNQIVMVEFDTFNNRQWDPPDVEGHVGINNNSISSAVYTSWNGSFHSGDTADVLITYNATTKSLRVAWTYQTTSNPIENSSLSYQIDLTKVLPEWVTIGFSAATGQSMERHALKSWEFSSSLDIKETNKKNAEKTRIIVGVTCSVSGLIIAGVMIILWRRKKIRREAAETMNLTSINDALERGAGPRRFSYMDLASATSNFSDERKLGEGGFGAVYRGYLNDLDMAIAVKKISRGSKQGKKEYLTEVKIISRLRHRNLVQLIGWCHDRGEFLLVYELMPNGSLDTHLFGEQIPLSWPQRHKIALGLASSLVYLHEEWEQCVVHRDIKPSNVMLDSNFNVKLSDFGLARFMDHELGLQTTGLAGTLGYMAPEYISTGRPSKETDVYSFGVVALEIATGRKSIDPERFEMRLVDWVWDLYEKGKLLSTVDERLHMEFDENQIECLMIVGLWCAHPVPSLRASIRQAIQVLNFEAELPNLPMKMPVPLYQLPSPSVSSTEPFITNSSLEVGR